MLKVNADNEYKAVERVYSGSTEIDKILDKNGNVLFAVNKEVEGTPALTYTGKEETNLKNYRIYGNTVNGESIGDRTGNLWDETIIQGGTNNMGTISDGNPKRLRSDYIFVEPGETYSFASNLKIRLIYSYDDDNQKVSLIRDAPLGDISYTFTVPNAATKIIITVMKRINNVEYDITPDDFEWGQLEKGSVVTSYEPYGYRVPVTTERSVPHTATLQLHDCLPSNMHFDKTTTNIYLPEQIKIVGDEAEYIDYGEQKMHRVRKNLLLITATSQTVNGVTFTVNSDRSITCDGTATGTIFLYLANKRSYPFDTILNGCPQGGSSVGYILRAVSKVSQVIIYTDFGNGVLIPANTQVELEIRVQNGTECNNLKFKPMIRKADIIDDTYEPYIENTDLDVTLPALPTLSGTNTLSVGTEVQPSNVYLKGRIKEAST